MKGTQQIHQKHNFHISRILFIYVFDWGQYYGQWNPMQCQAETHDRSQVAGRPSQYGWSVLYVMLKIISLTPHAGCGNIFTHIPLSYKSVHTNIKCIYRYQL